MNLTYDHYVYYCGQESLRRNGVGIIVNKRVWNAVLLLLLSCFSHVRLCVTPIDGSPPGSTIPGILQARTLEWVAISFSNAWKWKVKVKSLRRVWLLATTWIAAYQAPPSLWFSRQEYWSGLPLPSPSKCSTWMESQNDRMISCLFPRQTIQYHGNPSLCPDQ